MLRKMLFQGLFAAAVIAGSAAIYAGVTAAEPAQIAAGPDIGSGPVRQGGTGYLQPVADPPTATTRGDRESRDRHGMRERMRRRSGDDHVDRNGVRDQDDD